MAWLCGFFVFVFGQKRTKKDGKSAKRLDQLRPKLSLSGDWIGFEVFRAAAHRAGCFLGHWGRWRQCRKRALTGALFKCLDSFTNHPKQVRRPCFYANIKKNDGRKGALLWEAARSYLPGAMPTMWRARSSCLWMLCGKTARFMPRTAKRMTTCCNAWAFRRKACARRRRLRRCPHCPLCFSKSTRSIPCRGTAR